jgi:hypothetical protein
MASTVPSLVRITGYLTSEGSASIRTSGMLEDADGQGVSYGERDELPCR